MICNYPECKKKLVTVYYYHNPYGYVCLLHDRTLGREAMLEGGATLMEVLMFEQDVDRWEAREKRKVNGHLVDKRWRIKR